MSFTHQRPAAEGYSWIITKDHINGDEIVPSRANVVGGGSAFFPWDENGRPLEGYTTYPFKIYDDDRELYYEGEIYFADDEEEGFEEAVYAPLEWAMRDAGAVYIQYPGHREWDCG